MKRYKRLTRYYLVNVDTIMSCIHLYLSLVYFLHNDVRSVQLSLPPRGFQVTYRPQMSPSGNPP